MSGRRASGHAARVGASATSLARRRLLTNVDLGGSTQTALLIAPPGTGKTTLLAGLAARVATRTDAVIARYQAPLAAESSSSLLRKLVESWRPALGTNPARIRTFEVLLHRVGASDAQFFLFVDDAQRLIGQSAADGLTALLTDAPGNLSIAVASRTDVLPSVSLLKGSTPTVRIGYDDLRFRAGETAQLFAEVYRRPLPPEAAAELCRLTDGWATALRMFDLDHRMLDDAARSDAVSMASVDSPLLRDYLHNTIMSSLPDSIQDFMIQACPLGVLEGRLCDAFLGRTGSAAVLKGLAAGHLLVFQSGVAGGYFHFHTLLQRHLERLLAERTGPVDAGRLYRRAAEHLVDRGHWPEAYRAFAHAEEWVGAAQVLRASRAKWETLYASAFVPAALLRDDPWVALANARRFRGNGQFAQACEAYDEAVAGFGDPRMRWRATVERATVSRWLAAGPEPVPDSPDDQTDDLSRYLRAALDNQPARLLVHSEHDITPAWRLVQALATALDGKIEQAVRLAGSIADSTDRFVAIAGRLTAAGLAAMSPTPATSPSTFTALMAEAESAGWPWLARLARAATALADPNYLPDATAVLDECRRLEDDWGALLAGVAITLARWRGGDDATVVLRDTLRLARRLDAVALETWLHRRSTAEAVDPGMPSDDAPSYLPAAGPDPADPAPVVLHCFGRYEFFVSGVLRDTSKLRRQARTVLWLLSLHVGKPVQEETLTSTIWPEVLPFKAKHRLHVAISSLRRALDPGAQPRASNLIVRVGSAYVLSPPPGSKVDLLVFESSIRRWRLTRSHASADELTRTLSTALDAYRGDLLTEAGPAEWVLTERDRLRTEAANAAAALAALQLEHDPHLAIGACMSGLRIDDLHYGLWRLLAEAHTRAGNRAEAARAQKAYTDLMSG